jgi:VIT1/CCC1 family predicted Fe2+/Mn2+ transporter
MKSLSPAARLKRSFLSSAGNIVFGMEDGTVSIFGLVFGVAATTTQSASILIAGASGAAAAAVSMMAGTYLDAETSRDARLAHQARLRADLGREPAAIAALLPDRLVAAGLTSDAAATLIRAVQHDGAAVTSLAAILQAPRAEASQGPLEQSLWMLVADFLSAAVPILPFALLPVVQARYVSVGVTLALLLALGVGRARIAGRRVARTVAETVSIGFVAALAGVAIGLLMNHIFEH